MLAFALGWWDAKAQAIISPPEVVRSEFVFEKAPFASSHASTIVETKRGLVTAWFAGTREGADDVGLGIRLELRFRLHVQRMQRIG